MKIISFIEEQVVIRNTGPPSESHLNIVRELTYQPVPDQALADDGFFSQVPNYGYWAE